MANINIWFMCISAILLLVFCVGCSSNEMQDKETEPVHKVSQVIDCC